MRLLKCGWVLFLGLGAILNADQVVLTNGDVITGSIVKKDGDKLTIKSEFLGEVSMPWKAVKSLKSDQDLTVVMPGGEAVLGKVAATEGTLRVVSAAASKSAPMAEVSAIRNSAEQHAWERLDHPGLLQLWSGAFDLGLAVARGNAHTSSFTNAFNATRATRKDKIAVHFTQIYAAARANGLNSTTANAVRGGWAYNRDVTPRLFLSTLNDYEHDAFQGLDLRFVAGGGVGLNAIKTERTNLTIGGGGDYSRENFSGHPARNSGEANFGDDLAWKFAKNSALTQSFHLFPNLTYTGEYRVNFDLGVVTAINKWLGWHVSASDRLLSDPPVGRQRNDLLLSTGFRLSFAR